MNEDGYSFTKEPGIFYYEFFSEGPNGKIRKVVQFQQISISEDIFIVKKQLVNFVIQKGTNNEYFKRR
jgi:surface antigen